MKHPPQHPGVVAIEKWAFWSSILLFLVIYDKTSFVAKI